MKYELYTRRTRKNQALVVLLRAKDNDVEQDVQKLQGAEGRTAVTEGNGRLRPRWGTRPRGQTPATFRSMSTLNEAERHRPSSRREPSAAQFHLLKMEPSRREKQQRQKLQISK